MVNKKIIEDVVEILKRGEDIPAEYQEILFPTTKKEYELKYAGKERKEKILSDTMSVPFQPIKHFGESKEEDWANKLIFGDNLQALKHLVKLKNEGKLKNADGTDGVRLVYIDPPFATKQDFKGNQGQKAYTDKVSGAHFIEFLRKRLILLKEILSDNGTIYVHLDWKKSHYIKLILDEIFGEENFHNEIIWCTTGASNVGSDFPKKHDTIFRYTKSSNLIFNKDDIRIPYSEGSLDRANRNVIARKGMKFDKIELNESGKVPEDYWVDIQRATRYPGEPVNYPTQKSEKLLERIIKASSNPGDIVLDCFAGSGTTGAVAEKLDRRWIMCDTGKLSIYTIQKRLMNLKKEIGNKGDDLQHKPFVLYNAGLYYDGKLLREMKGDEYKEFVLELFGCQNRIHKINGIDMHGTLNNHSVMIFDKEHFLTPEFIDELHNNIGNSIKENLFIIAPIGIVGFNEDYIKKGDKKYTVLRIPNSIIDYIKGKNFSKLEQPRSSGDINQTIDAVGFDFIYPPIVSSSHSKEKPQGTLLDEEYTITINEFEPIQLGSKIVEFKEPKKESLAMIMVDLDYNGEIFSLDKYYFADEVIKKDFKISLGDKIGEKIMIIYVDIFGNEKREVIKKEEF